MHVPTFYHHSAFIPPPQSPCVLSLSPFSAPTPTTPSTVPTPSSTIMPTPIPTPTEVEIEQPSLVYNPPTELVCLSGLGTMRYNPHTQMMMPSPLPTIDEEEEEELEGIFEPLEEAPQALFVTTFGLQMMPPLPVDDVGDVKITAMEVQSFPKEEGKIKVGVKKEVEANVKGMVKVEMPSGEERIMQATP